MEAVKCTTVLAGRILTSNEAVALNDGSQCENTTCGTVGLNQHSLFWPAASRAASMPQSSGRRDAQRSARITHFCFEVLLPFRKEAATAHEQPELDARCNPIHLGQRFALEGGVQLSVTISTAPR